MDESVRKFKPVNFCIYCGRSDGLLTDEHIIPLALNGVFVLPRASCNDCADITKKFEQKVARTIYGPLRIKLGFKTRRKKDRPKHLAVQYKDESGNYVHATLPVEDFPNIYVVATIVPPGILTGAPPSEMNPQMEIGLKGDPQEMARAIDALGKNNIGLANIFDWASLCRLIAKIAHCFVVAVIGTQGYNPLLPDLILGKSNLLGHYIGGIEGNQSEDSYDISLNIVEINNKNYLSVYMNLLGKGRLPTYQAIAGEITDLDLVLKNIPS